MSGSDRDEEEQWHRRIAAELDQRHGNWMILWGCQSRMFWAFALIDLGRGVYFGEEDPAELERRIGRAETTRRVRSRP